MEYMIGIGLLYLAGNTLMNKQNNGSNLSPDPKAKNRNVTIYTRDDIQDYTHLFDPDFGAIDVQQQGVIIGDATYMTGMPNPDTLYPYFQAMEDFEPQQYPIAQASLYGTLSDELQPQPFYPPNYQYSSNYPPS